METSVTLAQSIPLRRILSNKGEPRNHARRLTSPAQFAPRHDYHRELLRIHGTYVPNCSADMSSLPVSHIVCPPYRPALSNAACTPSAARKRLRRFATAQFIPRQGYTALSNAAIVHPPSPSARRLDPAGREPSTINPLCSCRRTAQDIGLPQVKAQLPNAASASRNRRISRLFDHPYLRATCPSAQQVSLGGLTSPVGVGALICLGVCSELHEVEEVIAGKRRIRRLQECPVLIPELAAHSDVGRCEGGR